MTEGESTTGSGDTPTDEDAPPADTGQTAEADAASLDTPADWESMDHISHGRD